VGTGYKKSEATKERVLKAAYEQFSTYGYHGASLREIATLCGISHPGIRHHFPTKEDLFIEVLRERDSRVRSIVETWIAEKGVSIEGVVEIARQNMTTPGLLELFTITAAQAGNPDHPAHDFFVMRYAERRRLYAKYLRIGQEQGTVRRDIDLEDTASTIVALLDGIAIQWMMGPEDVS
jgi:AcrR family transcriptional regulator